MIEEIDEDHLPQSCSAGSGNSFALLNHLSEYSCDGLKYKNMMGSSFMKNFIAVYRVTNTYLQSEYNIKLLAKKGIYSSISERELLHCTSLSNVRSIITNNFDPHRATRVKFGSGVSFSPDAAYANLQSSAGDGIRAMFVCKVMVGKTQNGSSGATPTGSCDTLVGNCGRVYVKFNEFEFYPTHVIFYRSCPVVSHRGQRSVQRI